MNYELWMRWYREADEADAKTTAVDLSSAPNECESPIERRLAVFLVPYAEQWGFKVIPQFKHDRFRYDFAIEKDGEVIAVIECDGMEFHSTSRTTNARCCQGFIRKAGGLCRVPIFGLENLC